MSAAENLNQNGAISPFIFEGSETPVFNAYDNNGQRTWLDSNGDLIEGIYIGMENEVYHALPAYSSSQIKTFVKKSPAHFFRQYISDIDRKRNPSRALQNTYDAGTYGHELILEPHGFYNRYFRNLVPSDYPNALRTTTELQEKIAELGIAGVPKSAAKARLIEEIKAVDNSIQIWDEVVAKHQNHPEHQNKKSIDAIVWDDAHRVEETCRANPDADLLIQDGLPEISFIVKCPRTGLWLKCRFDWLRFDCIAVDVKTTQSTDPEAFGRQAGNLGYHIQESFYTYVAALLDVDLKAFLFACIEYVDADLCEIYNLNRKEESMEKTLKGLDELKECLDTNVWGSRSQLSGITSIEIPKYCR